MDPPFPQHLTYKEAQNLKVGDLIDHRDSVGRFIPAIIAEKIQTSLKIHYIGWSEKWDVICSYAYQHELHRFAREGSISRRAAHRLKYLKCKNFLDINSISHPGWRVGEIRRMDIKSAQIQVIYEFEEKRYLRWMHLDDVNQCDVLGTHTMQKAEDNLGRLTAYFEARHTLTNTSDDIKWESLKEIAEETFNGISNMIDFIVKDCNISQLQKIQKIINRKNIEYEESLLNLTENTQNNDEIMEIDNNDQTSIKQKPKISSLTQLSRDVIGYISGYLSREDIAFFKVTSYKICIVCLKEMKKYNVGVFNVNALINDTTKKYIDLIGFKSLHHLTYSRYIQSTPYSHIFDEWQQIYDIPKQNQLLLPMGFTVGHLYKPQDIEPSAICQFSEVHRNFYLLDTRNIITLRNKYDSPMIMNENTENMNNKFVILLKWFDIYFQKIRPLQLIIVDSDPLNMISYERVVKYIKDEFIATTQQQTAWHQKVISYVNEMNPEQYQNSYRMYTEIPHQGKIMEINDENLSDTINMSINNGTAIFIFSLNPDHESLTNSKFATLVEKYHLIKK